MTSLWTELKEIDEVYRRTEAFILPRTHAKALSPGELGASKEQIDEAVQAYHDALARFQKLYNQMSKDDIIRAFEQGSDLLRRNLAGRMARDFSGDYVDVMEEAINRHQGQVAAIFLQVLARQMPLVGVPLIKKVLTSPEAVLRETGIYLIGELKLDELKVQVQPLLQDPIEDVARAAQRVLANSF